METEDIYADILLQSSKEWRLHESRWKTVKGNKGLRIIYQGEGSIDLLTFSFEE